MLNHRPHTSTFGQISHKVLKPEKKRGGVGERRERGREGRKEERKEGKFLLWSPKGVEDAYLPMHNCNFVSMHMYRNFQVSLLMEKRTDKDNQNTLANPKVI